IRAIFVPFARRRRSEAEHVRPTRVPTAVGGGSPDGEAAPTAVARPASTDGLTLRRRSDFELSAWREEACGRRNAFPRGEGASTRSEGERFRPARVRSAVGKGAHPSGSRSDGGGSALFVRGRRFHAFGRRAFPSGSRSDGGG